MMTLKEFFDEWNNDSPDVLVHTSGSTGEPKQIWVSKEWMLASARMTCDFLGIDRGGKALLCLPLDYIAGKMMVVRALERGMEIIEAEQMTTPLALIPHPSSLIPHPSSLIQLSAMVPMQVYNTLEVHEEAARLRQIKHLLIGGGAISEKLERKILDFLNKQKEGGCPIVWSTYGMTETLSHIALRRIDGSEDSKWYTPMAGVDVWLGRGDTLTIHAPHICERVLETHDVAVLREDTDLTTGKTIKRFKIIGRTDNVICSGGLKIHAEEVERLLMNHLPKPFAISKCKDEKLGEKVVLLSEYDDLSECESICRKVLPRHWVPRKFIYVEHIPMTPNGKIARAEAERLASQSPNPLF